MILYPAIDLHAGKCVRLFRGNFEQMTYYENTPLEMAKCYAQEGAEYLHIIDLEGAKSGSLKQTELIIQIYQETGLKIQIGGGIRRYGDIHFLFNHGIERIIIGSLAVTEPDVVKNWLAEFGSERIVLAFDVKILNHVPVVVIHGWQNTSQKTLWKLLKIYEKFSLRHVLCTDISLDGALSGTNEALYQSCHRYYPNIHFQASGGVASLEDLKTLKYLSLSGVVIGKALYEKRFSLREAIEQVKIC